MVNPGCKECSKSNETYCLGNDVIYDHCCCDRRFHESIPYVEHSCYIETTPCIPIVRDCGEYMKMMSCCCHRLLGTKWKNISMALAGESKLGSSSNVLLVSTTFVFSIQRGIL
ncbi:uncharacterized protein LOC111047205 isoform X1 [Nilaparvata lugens]|uniref:uncharacterized protein LOC111047205 isoform X1 n=1 Tax=Nilaparvata lugens TaxID=108931 RepID=UPI00193D0293|nr:uncharacterized protein LOC111047205 isoform X1 [Nilaparvata lugens]